MRRDDMEFHEAANIFPLDEEHLDELAADIKQHGLRTPIETMDGMILDGRHCDSSRVVWRYFGCSVEPDWREH